MTSSNDSRPFSNTTAVASSVRVNRSRSDEALSVSSHQLRRQVLSAVADAILSAVPFDEDSTVVMDYACGSGALSQRLAPYSMSILGVDINPAAVEQYNTKVANQGIPPQEMRAICLQLPERVAELDGQLFDVVVCSQAYHHFSSIDATTRLLTSFLKPRTGTLLVSDLLRGPHAHEFRHSCSLDHYHNVAHRGGLTETEMRGSFEASGLVDIDFAIIDTVRKEGRSVDIFLAQGVRPAIENFR